MANVNSHTRTTHRNLRGQLALTTAIVALAFGYGGRKAYAGACTGGPNTYSCSGATDAPTDMTQNLSGSPLTVTTTAGFGIDTSTNGGDAFTLNGTDGLTFTDNNMSSITGDDYGIHAFNSGGALSITTTGHVTGNNYDGIWALNDFGGTDLTISAKDVTGGAAGIFAGNLGAGATNVTATGPVTGNYGSGIYGSNFFYGTDLMITATDVTGEYDGVRAVHFGSGALSVTTTGQVTGKRYTGIYAMTYYGAGTDLTVNAKDVMGDDDGIYAFNGGEGALTVTATGQVTGTNGNGIKAINFNYDGTNLTVNAKDVTGGDDGIEATNYGTGFLKITTTGKVMAGDDGIDAYNSSYGTSLTIEAKDVTGIDHGIKAINNGSGINSITVSGTVAGGTGAGIATYTGSLGMTTITLESGAAVSATSGMAITNNEGDSSVLVKTGASVTGAISLGDGTDSITFDGGNFSGVTSFDGGGGTSDSLTFRNVSGGIAGSTVQGMESVVVDTGADISVSGTLTTQQLTVQNGGMLGPGMSPGLLQVLGNMEVQTGATLKIELGGLVVDTGYDRIDVGDDGSTVPTEGIATLLDGAIFDIDYFGIFTAGLGDFFDVLVADNIVLSALSSLTFDFSGAGLAGGLSWNTSIVDFGNNREALRLSVVSAGPAQVPEPSALALFGLGALGLAGLRRMRRNGSAPTAKA